MFQVQCPDVSSSTQRGFKFNVQKFQVQRPDVSSSTSRCFKFNAQIFQVQRQNVSISMPRCFKFNAHMFQDQRPDVSSSTPRCFMFNVQMFHVQHPDVSSSTPRCSSSTTRCFKFNALMYQYHVQCPDVSLSTARCFKFNAKTIQCPADHFHWYCCTESWGHYKKLLALLIYLFYIFKRWLLTVYEVLKKKRLILFRPPPQDNKAVISSTCDWSAVKSSNCDWSAYEIVHMRLADPPPSHDESSYTPHALVRFKTEGTGQVRSVTNQNVFTSQDKTPPKVLIIICPKSAPSPPSPALSKKAQTNSQQKGCSPLLNNVVICAKSLQNYETVLKTGERGEWRRRRGANFMQCHMALIYCTAEVTSVTVTYFITFTVTDIL